MKNFKKKIYWMSTVLLITTTACNEKADDNNLPILLTEYNRDWDGGYDYSTIEYNTQNKVVKINNTYSEGETEEQLTLEYQYNAQGELKEEQYYFNDDSIKYKNVYTKEGNSLTYREFLLDTSGRWKDEFYGAVISYNTQGKVILNQFYSGWSDESIIYSDSTVYNWENENVVESKMFRVNRWDKKNARINRMFSLVRNSALKMQKSGNIDNYTSNKMSYDEKINPFTTVGFAYHYIFQNKNNVIEDKLTYEDGIIAYDKKITYEYNEKNYPVHASVKENDLTIETISYKYNE